MASVDDQRRLLAAMAQGGSAGVQAYERYRQQANAVEQAAYRSLVGEIGDPTNPYYRELLSQYTTPYQSDAQSASDLWGETLRYIPYAAQATQSEYDRRLSQARHQFDVEREIDMLQRQAQETQSADGSVDGLSDLSLTEQEAIIRGYAELMGDEQAAKNQSTVSAIEDYIQNQQEELAELRRKQKELAAQVFALGLSGKDNSDVLKEARELSARERHIEETIKTRQEQLTRARQSAEVEAGLLDTPEAVYARALAVAQELYDDPGLARGLVEHWFGVDPGEQEAAVNELLYGNPEGEVAAWQEKRDEEEMRAEMAADRLADSEGVSTAKFNYALSEAKLDIEDAVELMQSDAWEDVRDAYKQALSEEPKFGEDPVTAAQDKFLELLDDLDLSVDEQAFAVSLYFD